MFSIYVKVYVYVTGTLEYMLGNHVLVVASHECMRHMYVVVVTLRCYNKRQNNSFTEAYELLEFKYLYTNTHLFVNCKRNKQYRTCLLVVYTSVCVLCFAVYCVHDSTHE